MIHLDAFFHIPVTKIPLTGFSSSFASLILCAFALKSGALKSA